MAKHELEASKPSLLALARQPENEESKAPDTQMRLALQRDALAGVAGGIGTDATVQAHAAALQRSSSNNHGSFAPSVLGLQRRYGNRYVQRVVALARQEKGEASVAPEVEQAIHGARSGGQALDSGVRTQMEESFAADFSGVHVHTDAQADTLNRALSARAFTTGRDVFFRQGAYEPGSSNGRELIAHELTHVVQQKGADVQRKLTVGQPGDRYEQEAERVARQVVNMPGFVRQKEVDNEDELMMKPVAQRVGEGGYGTEGDFEDRVDGSMGGRTLQRRTLQQGSKTSGLTKKPESVRHPKLEPVRQNEYKNEYEPVQQGDSLALRRTVGNRPVQRRVARRTNSANGGPKSVPPKLARKPQNFAIVQRYEAGEHAQLGETQAELKTELAPTTYLVRRGDGLSAIAKKFGITVPELKDANKSKLKKWPAWDGGGRMIEGFSIGETVSIPQKLNNFSKAAIAGKSATFTINGVLLDYGVGIAMADLFESPEQMAQASPKELTELAALIKREQSGGKLATTEEWQKATGGRYLALAEKNDAHFAPSDPGIVTPFSVEVKSGNHKSIWEKYHKVALDFSRSGDMDRALMTNAYADHFLTDAFSAGHLINKHDIMERFKSQLKLDVKTDEFTLESQKFFDSVAKDAFTGTVKSEFSKYETVEFKGAVFRPDINSVSRFSVLLQAIHKEEPDLLSNAVAKGVHDKLNTLPGGLPVENAKGDNWTLSGDGTLNVIDLQIKICSPLSGKLSESPGKSLANLYLRNYRTKGIARQAVARSQINVISVNNLVGPLNYSVLFKNVWDYVPKPSTTGTTQLVDTVKLGTDVMSADLKIEIVKLITKNYQLIIDELVKRKKLRKA